MCAEPRRGSGLEAEEGPGAEARGGVSSQEGRVIGKARRWGVEVANSFLKEGEERRREKREERRGEKKEASIQQKNY